MAGFRGLFVRKGTVGTQPDEARKALAGLLTPVTRLGARQGILAAPGSPLQVTGTASWQYSVSSGHLVSSRSDSDGAMLFGNDGTTLTAAVAAAPGSGSRYDLIYLRHLDPDQGEGDPSAVIGVVSGTASGTPVKPAVPAGAVTIAEALVAAGATSTQHANVTITQVLGKTVARGGLLPVPNLAARNALTQYDGLHVKQEDTGVVQVSDGAAWWPVGAAANPVEYASTLFGASGNFNNTTPANYTTVNYNFIPTRDGWGRVHLDLDVAGVATGFGSAGIQVVRDGAVIDADDILYDPGARTKVRYRCHKPILLRQGVLVAMTLRVYCFSGSGSWKINGAQWRIEQQ